jgi:hypothetical protein
MINPTPAGSIAGPPSPVKLTNQAQAAAGKDPELSLMLQIVTAEANGKGRSEASMEPDSNNIMALLNLYRWRKSAGANRILRLESAVCTVLSGSGQALVLLTESAALKEFDLTTGGERQTVQLAVPSKSARDPNLDSCGLSLSSDDRFAVVSMRTLKGSRGLNLVPLDSSKMPDLELGNFDTASFGNGFLALGQGKTLRIVRTADWTDVFTQQLPIGGDIARLFSEPDSNVLGVSDNKGDTRAFIIDPTTRTAQNVYGVSGGSCNSGLEGISCSEDNRLLIMSNEPYQGSLACPSGCKIFPSSSTRHHSSWFAIFQTLTEPNILKFASLDAYSRTPQFQTMSITLDEPVLIAKLLGGDTVVAISRAGAVYRFSARGYVDCCDLAIGPNDPISHVAAGSGDVSAVLSSNSGTSYLNIFHADTLAQRIQIASDTVWVREVNFSQTNRFIILAGQDRLRIIELDAALKQITARDFMCGLPFDLAPTTMKLVCMNSGTDRLAIYSLTNGHMQHELMGHDGPISAVSINKDSVRAAGAYQERSASMISVWDASDGRLLSSRTCPANGITGPKAIAFVHGGSDFLALESNSLLVLRESSSCQSGGTVNVYSDASRLFTITPSLDGALVHAADNTIFSRIRVSMLSGLIIKVEAPIQELSLAPDTQFAVLLATGRVLRIPLTLAATLDTARRRISRKFSTEECLRYFADGNCPVFEQVSH